MSIEPVKTLLVAHTGRGKTGASASLAAMGLKLRYLDLDNGVDILRNLLTDPLSDYVKVNAKVWENVESVISLAETRKSSGGKLLLTRAEVWPKAMSLFDQWIDPRVIDPATQKAKDFGPITSWTPEHVLGIGSLTRLAESALRFVQGMNGRLGQHPWQSDYGDAQNLLKGFLENITSPDVQCNVVLECHIESIGDGTGIEQDFPRAIGKALSPIIGSYFNSLLEVKMTGRGESIKRVICAVPTGTLGVKNTAPFRVKKEYSIETGLAEYFQAVRGSA